MRFLAEGEWLAAAVGFSGVLLFAVTGVILLGWWVWRGDRRNRLLESTDATGERAGQSALGPTEEH